MPAGKSAGKNKSARSVASLSGTTDVGGDTTLLCLLCNVFVNANAKFG